MSSTRTALPRRRARGRQEPRRGVELHEHRRGAARRRAPGQRQHVARPRGTGRRRSSSILRSNVVRSIAVPRPTEAHGSVRHLHGSPTATSSPRSKAKAPCVSSTRPAERLGVQGHRRASRSDSLAQWQHAHRRRPVKEGPRGYARRPDRLGVRRARRPHAGACLGLQRSGAEERQPLRVPTGSALRAGRASMLSRSPATKRSSGSSTITSSSNRPPRSPRWTIRENRQGASSRQDQS